ncbi:CopG family transcriptional regulator [candidate division CSSED10-310 bacterium]|uniref:CopG family transcriptional regulator n=1 Tax=candidate division CSSED10-310 bacterium TaxID=2855610 RepID=A0ABV6Z200_UNCC1
MTQNITLRMDKDILRKCRHAAVEADMSLSQWVIVQLTNIINQNEALSKTRQNALKKIEKGYSLGGKPLLREDIYERNKEDLC